MNARTFFLFSDYGKFAIGVGASTNNSNPYRIGKVGFKGPDVNILCCCFCLDCQGGVYAEIPFHIHGPFFIEHQRGRKLSFAALRERDIFPLEFQLFYIKLHRVF